MKMSQLQTRWIWPGVILLSAAVMSSFFFAHISSPLRLIATLWFLLVCPGMAFVKLLRFDESRDEWILAVALSIAMDGIVAYLLLYTHVWSAQLALSVMIVLSLLGACFQIQGGWPQPARKITPKQS